jgi:hypothetical protein
MTMTKKQYREYIKKLGMTQGGAARFLGMSDRSSRRFAAGDDIPQQTELLLRMMIAKRITPEKAFEIAGLKLPPQGFGDARARDE